LFGVIRGVDIAATKLALPLSFAMENLISFASGWHVEMSQDLFAF